MRKVKFVAIAASLVFVACQDSPTVQDPVLDGSEPQFAISDGAHEVAGVESNPHFFFKFPLVWPPRNRRYFTGEFDGGLSPTVEICRRDALVDDQCGDAAIAVLTTEPGDNRYEQIRVSERREKYWVFWNTRDVDLERGDIYRINVVVGERRLGYVDAKVVRNVLEWFRVLLEQDDEDDGFAPLLQHSRLFPIPFRIEVGALCNLSGASPCITETISLDEDNTIVLEDGGDPIVILDVPAQPDADGDVTFTLQRCTEIDDLPLDIPLFGNCFEIVADPPLEGEALLTIPAVVTLCEDLDLSGLANPSQEGLVTLHQLHVENGDTTIIALPHAGSPCVSGDQAPVPLSRMASAGWRAVQSFLAPRLLVASGWRRLDRGKGGSTGTFGSSFQFGLPSKMEQDPNTDDQLAQEDEAVTNEPTVYVSDAFGSPVREASVTFTVTDGGGRIGSTVITVRSGPDGLASVPWWLGPGPVNTLEAFGAGIATPGNNGPDEGFDPYVPVVDEGGPAFEIPALLGAGFEGWSALSPLPSVGSCRTDDFFGEQIFQGFYIPEYGGSTIERIDLLFAGDSAGEFDLVLTAYDGGFDGAVLGSSTTTVALSGDKTDFTRASFLFESMSVTSGDIVAFAIARDFGDLAPAQDASVSKAAGSVTVIRYAVPNGGNEECPAIVTKDTIVLEFLHQGVEMVLWGMP